MFRDDVVKIGKTSRAEMNARLKELNRGTGVPCPFECYVAYEMDNYDRVEDIMHTIYRGVGRHTDPEHRKKEFFRVEAQVADAVLSKIATLMKGKKIDLDATKVYNKEQLAVLEENLQANRKKERNFLFSEYKIPVGAQLTFINDDNIVCKVKVAKGKTKVEYKGKEYSLSSLTTEILQKQGYTGQHYSGYKYWMYNGQILSDMRNSDVED